LHKIKNDEIEKVKLINTILTNESRVLE